MAVRIYTNHTDDELRRAANADNEDIDALQECARRFAAQDNYRTLDEIEADIDSAREEGYAKGYEEGVEETREQMYSPDELDKAVEEAVEESMKQRIERLV